MKKIKKHPMLVIYRLGIRVKHLIELSHAKNALGTSFWKRVDTPTLLERY